MGIKPLSNRVLVKPVPRAKETKSGLVLGSEKSQEKPRLGEVLEIGRGKYDNNGNLIGVCVNKGDKVMYAPYSGYNAGDPTYPFVNEDDPILIGEDELLAVVTD